MTLARSQIFFRDTERIFLFIFPRQLRRRRLKIEKKVLAHLQDVMAFATSVGFAISISWTASGASIRTTFADCALPVKKLARSWYSCRRFSPGTARSSLKVTIRKHFCTLSLNIPRLTDGRANGLDPDNCRVMLRDSFDTKFYLSAVVNGVPATNSPRRLV